jgi:hypothetical protein
MQQYYDFRSTYSDDEDESTAESGGVKVNDDGDDQGWGVFVEILSVVFGK